jgi:modification methylase
MDGSGRRVNRHELPSSVWATAQQPAGVQRRGRYLAESTAHPGKMLPAIARRAIATYSQPGDLVLDPMCGIGTSLVEATHLDRKATGVELEPRWVQIAKANLAQARALGAPGRGRVTAADARQLGRGLLDHYQGRVQLILSSPPYGASLHGQVDTQPDGIDKWDNRYSHNPHNLAQLPSERHRGGRNTFSEALLEILSGCQRMLAANGYLVLTARPYRRHGQLVDLPGHLEQLADQAGLQLQQRLVALLCAVRDGTLVPRASFFQMRHQRSGAIPRMLLIAHEDVLVFTPHKARR